MIVIGSDPHKRSYTFSAVVAETGELRGSETVAVSSAGHQRMLDWARALDVQRVWAVEDCRHVSAKLELPIGCLDRLIWLERLAGRLARTSQDADVRVMRHQIRRLRELVRETNALKSELLLLVRGLQPRLLDVPGVGTLTAAKLIAEI